MWAIAVCLGALLVSLPDQGLCCGGSRKNPRPRPPPVPRPRPTTRPVARCELTTYKGNKFRNSARVQVDFLPHMRNINSYAASCNVEVYVTSSYRRSSVVSGAIVTPAKRSNHMVGHAIDMNLIDGATGKWCNSKCLQKASGRPSGVTCFIRQIRADRVLVWGGDFRKRDPVHIDDRTNNNSALWTRLFNSIKKNC